MRPFNVRRRPDGVIELRRRRIHDAAVTPDVAVLLALLAACIGFVTLVTCTLLASPGLIAVPGAVALLGFWAGALARKTRVAPAAQPPPAAPPRAG